MEKLSDTDKILGLTEPRAKTELELTAFTKETKKSVEESLVRLGWQQRKSHLLTLIDQSLTDKDEEKFNKYTEELKAIDEKNMI